MWCKLSRKQERQSICLMEHLTPSIIWRTMWPLQKTTYLLMLCRVKNLFSINYYPSAYRRFLKFALFCRIIESLSDFEGHSILETWFQHWKGLQNFIFRTLTQQAGELEKKLHILEYHRSRSRPQIHISGQTVGARNSKSTRKICPGRARIPQI